MSTAIPFPMQSIPPLTEVLLDKPSPETKKFTIDTPEKAAWAARKIIDSENRITSFKEQAKAYKAKIDRWFEKTVIEDLDSIEHLRRLIRPYIEEEVSRQRKSKTVHLPGIAVQLRKKSAKIDIIDPDTAISFCEMNHPDAVIIKKDISKAYVKQLLSKGELIPGCEMVPGTSELYFKED